MASSRKHAHVDHQGVAVGLGGRVVVVARPDRAPVGEEDEAAEVVGGLAPVQLAANTSAERLVTGLPQDMQGGL